MNIIKSIIRVNKLITTKINSLLPIGTIDKCRIEQNENSKTVEYSRKHGDLLSESSDYIVNRVGDTMNFL